MALTALARLARRRQANIGLLGQYADAMNMFGPVQRVTDVLLADV